MTRKKILLYSRLAFYPMHWQAYRSICESHDVDASVITTDYCELPDGHKMLGWTDPEMEKKTGFSPKIYYISRTNKLIRVLTIFKHLRAIKPDIIWAQEEPTCDFIIPVLVYYFFTKKPRIVAAVTENIFLMSGVRKIFFNILWKRLNGILSVAPGSTTAIREAGMPLTVDSIDFAAGCLSPKENLTAMDIPLKKNEGDFFVGYVGRLCPEKGWKVIMSAIRMLPKHYKFILAGNGAEEQDLRKMMEEPELKDRIYYAGLLPKDELWRFYKAMDCLVVSSLTTKNWKEQFGGILADAMAVGIPIIGSDSGSIPEVTGSAGIIVPENNPTALSLALEKFNNDAELRKSLGENGKKRFAEEFSISAYARKIAIGLGLTN